MSDRSVTHFRYSLLTHCDWTVFYAAFRQQERGAVYRNTLTEPPDVVRQKSARVRRLIDSIARELFDYGLAKKVIADECAAGDPLHGRRASGARGRSAGARADETGVPGAIPARGNHCYGGKAGLRATAADRAYRYNGG